MHVAVSEPRIGQRVPGVELDGILKALNGQTHGCRRSLMPVVTSLEVQLIRLRVLRRSFHATAQPHLEPVCNRPGDLILYLEEVLHLTIVALRPQMEAVSDINELHRDADPVGGTPDATLEDVRHIELRPDFTDLDRLAFKGER